MRSLRLVLPFSILSLLLGTSASAAIIPGQVVVRVGDTPPGADGPVATLRAPFAESGGAVGFSGTITGGDNFIFRDGAVIFHNTDAMGVTLGAHENAIGTAEGGLYAFSPSISSQDGLFVNNAVFGRATEQAPGMPMGTVATFYGRPTMVDGGVLFWIMGINDAGMTATQNRVLATSVDGTPAMATPVLQGGQTVDGFTISGVVGDPSNWEGIQDQFQASFDANHLIAVVDLDNGQEAIIADAAIVARETQLSGDGVTNWQSFTNVAIDSAGNYAFVGNTDGATGVDEVIVYNGSMVVREGDTVAGVALPGGVTSRYLSLDDNGNMLHMWGGGALPETVFYSCGLDDSPITSQVLIAVDDELDTNNDTMGDGIVITDFSTLSNAALRPLSNAGSIYLEVLVTSDGGVSESEAIIELAAPSCCGNGVPEPGEACDDGNLDDTDACISCVAAVCGDGIVQAGEEECDDAGESATCDDDCTAVACGDGNVNEMAGEDCEDGNDDNTDACVACQDAACGDGFVWTDMEDCDTAGESATCDADCTVVECGDMTVNDAAGEDCDDGMETATCDADCTDAVCGDGTINNTAGETCDDSGKSDMCDANCTSATCGDGYVNTLAGEMCDGDGNGNPGETAACDTNCTDSVCGDGDLNTTAGEECDAGGEAADCDANCTAVSCGDGDLNATAGEECDDGNTEDGDGCDATCLEEGGEETGTGTESGSDSGDTGDTGDTTGGPTTGDDSSSGEPPGTTTATGSGTSPTGSGTATTATSAGTDTDTDTEGGGGGASADGCGCTTDGPAKPLPAALLGLLFLGLTRRRRDTAA